MTVEGVIVSLHRYELRSSLAFQVSLKRINSIDGIENHRLYVQGLTSGKGIVFWHAGVSIFAFSTCFRESLWEKHCYRNLVVLLAKSVRTVIWLLRLCDPLASCKLFNEVSILRRMTEFPTLGNEYYETNQYCPLRLCLICEQQKQLHWWVQEVP